MSAGEAEETQSAYEDGAGGPGAPTPLSALEVSACPQYCVLQLKLMDEEGCRRTVSARYQIDR